MAGELWASAISLAGVALGGGVASLTQRAAQRAAERTEERRQTSVTAEARRAEQLQALKEFIECAQHAESAAYSRPEQWGPGDDGWNDMAAGAMSRLWVASGNVRLICDPTIHDPVRDYGRALNQAVWRDIGDVEVNEHLEDHKAGFFAAARQSLA